MVFLAEMYFSILCFILISSLESLFRRCSHESKKAWFHMQIETPGIWSDHDGLRRDESAVFLCLYHTFLVIMAAIISNNSFVSHTPERFAWFRIE